MSNKRPADSSAYPSAKQSKTTVDAFHEALTLLDDTSNIPSTSSRLNDEAALGADEASKGEEIVTFEQEEQPEPSSSKLAEVDDIQPSSSKAAETIGEEEPDDIHEPMENALSEEDDLARIRTQLLLANFTSEQLDRYEAMRRASFPKSVVRRLINRFSNTAVNQNVVIAIAGMAKVFTGELIEEALDIQQKSGEAGPLTPRHLTLAYSNLGEQGKLFPAHPRKNPLARPDAMF